MVVKTIFELQSIKDQLALIASLTSHIDPEKYREVEMEEDMKKLLTKAENLSKNLKEKLDALKNILDN